MIPKALADSIYEEVADLPVDARTFLTRDFPLGPPGLVSPNGHCRLVKSLDGWIAVNLAREDDAQSVPAWLESDRDQAPWDAILETVPRLKTAHLLERASLLCLPVSKVGETKPTPPPSLYLKQSPKRKTVIDLSALWAGPLCGSILANAGMAVTKVEDPARPDPVRLSTPHHHARLNGKKRHISIALAEPQLIEAISTTDVLITSARGHALARLGLTPEALLDRNPKLIWIAITAHGFVGAGAMRVGFGDDCAAAGGLLGWREDIPQFLGDALADPLTGVRAARLALNALAEGAFGLIDVALASTAADFAARAGFR